MVLACLRCALLQTTKFIMQYLAMLGKNVPSKSSSGGGERDGVAQAVLQSNPILEALGNARTIRNDNSSRFGASPRQSIGLLCTCCLLCAAKRRRPSL